MVLRSCEPGRQRDQDGFERERRWAPPLQEAGGDRRSVGTGGRAVGAVEPPEARREASHTTGGRRPRIREVLPSERATQWHTMAAGRLPDGSRSEPPRPPRRADNIRSVAARCITGCYRTSCYRPEGNQGVSSAGCRAPRLHRSGRTARVTLISASRLSRGGDAVERRRATDVKKNRGAKKTIVPLGVGGGNPTLAAATAGTNPR